MARPILTDPILNDVARFVCEPKLGLNGHAVTRYLTHLQRLDIELKDARKGTGNRPIGVSQATIQISSQAVNAMTAEIERLTAALERTVAEALQMDRKGQGFDRLADALFAEFGEDLGTVDGETPVDIALGLLRKWHPSAEKSTEATDETASSPETTLGDDAARVSSPVGGLGPGEDYAAARSGAAGRGARNRRP